MSVKTLLNKSNPYLVFGGTLLFVLGLTTGLLFQKSFSSDEIRAERLSNKKFLLINPLLSCNISENKEFEEYKPLEQLIKHSIEKSDPTKVQTASVYYRDINSGRWFAINEDGLYSPASLFKVPLMIAYLKQAEKEPGVLSKELYYDLNAPDPNIVEYYKSKNGIVRGNYYTVDDLLKSMVRYSDNAAASLLFNAMDKNSLAEVLTDMGIHIPQTTGATGTVDFLTVKSYSYLFRLLYNSTYLTPAMSEKAMELLHFADFPQGIVATIPKEVVAVQKFGERTDLTATGAIASRELHDCGIVYYPNHPYLLCIMTKGYDFDALSALIRSTSSLVYSEVAKEYPH